MPPALVAVRTLVLVAERRVGHACDLHAATDYVQGVCECLAHGARPGAAHELHQRVGRGAVLLGKELARLFIEEKVERDVRRNALR